MSVGVARRPIHTEPHFALSTAHHSFQQDVRAWVREHVAPYADAVDGGAFPAVACRAAAVRGYTGIVVPSSYGGLGLDHLSFALFVEETARACASTAVALDVHASVGTEPLLLLGSADQKSRYLPGLAAGHLLGAFALTEPEAGSDAASLRTVARRDGDDYVLDGSKIFITNAGHAGLYTVLATTDRGRGAKGINAFLVPAETPGLSIGPLQHKMGLRGSATAEVILRGCRVPVANRLGAEGDGFKVAMLALDSGRIGISAQALGIARAALDEAISIFNAHGQGGANVPQGAQFALADMATGIEAAAALTWQAARECDGGKPFTTVASMAKLLSTDTAMAATTTALDLVADIATPPELRRLERFFRDAKATQLYEGTNQIQRVVIARRLLGFLNAVQDLAARVLRGDVRAIARMITRLENGTPDAVAQLSTLFSHTGMAYILGVTGPPGAGKSTLVDGLIRQARNLGATVAVLAVDPSSPFTGGAILGDRIRMQAHAYDTGVFIRSMGARGHLGGLALTTRKALHVLDAAGFNVIVIETVGVGQSELDIARAADTTLVVVTPGIGDTVQMMKAGILEIADIFAMNKADQEGASQMLRALRGMVHMAPAHAWNIPIVETQAHDAVGVPALWDAITAHRDYLERTGELARRRAARLREELLDLVERGLRTNILQDLAASPQFSQLLDEVVARRRDPDSAARDVLAGVHARPEQIGAS